MVPTDIDIKTLIGWPMTFASQMPFTGEKCLVTVALERFGEGHFFVREIVAVDGGDERIAVGLSGLPGNPIGDVHSHGMAAGQNTCTRGAANRARGVTLRETHAAGGQPVDVRRLVKFTAIGADVRPAHIVHEKENKVGLLRSLGILQTAEDAE
mgnify:CR=1 FL=1